MPKPAGVVSVVGAAITPPKSGRDGHPHCLRVTLAKGVSDKHGLKKLILGCGTEPQMVKWMSRLQYAAAKKFELPEAEREAHDEAATTSDGEWELEGDEELLLSGALDAQDALAGATVTISTPGEGGGGVAAGAAWLRAVQVARSPRAEVSFASSLSDESLWLLHPFGSGLYALLHASR